MGPARLSYKTASSARCCRPGSSQGGAANAFLVLDCDIYGFERNFELSLGPDVDTTAVAAEVTPPSGRKRSGAHAGRGRVRVNPTTRRPSSSSVSG